MKHAIRRMWDWFVGNPTSNETEHERTGEIDQYNPVAWGSYTWAFQQSARGWRVRRGSWPKDCFVPTLTDLLVHYAQPEDLAAEDWERY